MRQFILILILFHLLFKAKITACSCGTPSHDWPALEERIKNADFIFVGVVREIVELDNIMILGQGAQRVKYFTFEILRVNKSAPFSSNYITAFDDDENSSCRGFLAAAALGDTVLVYSRKGFNACGVGETVSGNMCTPYSILSDLDSLRTAKWKDRSPVLVNGESSFLADMAQWREPDVKYTFFSKKAATVIHEEAAKKQDSSFPNMNTYFFCSLGLNLLLLLLMALRALKTKNLTKN